MTTTAMDRIDRYAARFGTQGLGQVAARGGHDWYRVEAKDSGEAEVWIYDEIGYWGTTGADFAQALAAIDAKTITLRLNSPGGSVFDGVAIHNALAQHPATVNVVVDGIAASIASVIAMAGDSVVMGRGTRMMIHNPAGVAIGGAAEFRAFADLLDELAKDIGGFYSARAGGSLDQWLASMDAETWYSAQEAVDAGLADSVLGAAPVPENVKTFDLNAYGFRYAGREGAPDPRALARKARSDAAKARVRNALKG